MHEITSIVGFSTMKEQKNGYVAIIDKPNKTSVVHPVTCSHVDLRNFVEKVIKNKRKNGQYYWCESIDVAKRELHAVPCSEVK